MPLCGTTYSARRWEVNTKFRIMAKDKSTKKPGGKGSRPRKQPELHKGDAAMKRFTAGMGHVLAAGPTPPAKPG